MTQSLPAHSLGAPRQIAEKITRNTREVLGRSREEKILPREAAVELALERVKAAMHYRQRK